MHLTTTHSHLPLEKRFDLFFMSASAGDNEGRGSSEGSASGQGPGGSGAGDDNSGGFGGFGLGVDAGSFGGNTSAGLGLSDAGIGNGGFSTGGLGGFSEGYGGIGLGGATGQNGFDLGSSYGGYNPTAIGISMQKNLGLIQALSKSPNISTALGAMGASLANVLGGKIGSSALGAIGGSLAGPIGAIMGSVIGAKYGKQTAEAVSASVMENLQNSSPFDEATISSIAGKTGVSPQDLESALNNAYSDQGVNSAYEQAIRNNPETFVGGIMATPAGTQASYQQQALDYLKQREALPRAISEGSLQQLAAAYGLPNYEQQTEQFYSGIPSDPIYQAIMGGLPQGEEAILRNAGATGMLRSGNVQDALGQNAIDLNRQAILDTLSTRLSGLSSLAGTPTYTSSIANAMTGIGKTQAAGQLADEQRQQQELGMWLGLGLKGYEQLGGWEGIGDIASDVGGWFGF